MPGIILCNLSKSALQILDFIKHNEPVTPKTISQSMTMSMRTVFYGINSLVDENLLAKTPNLDDMRNTLYSINRERFDDIKRVVSVLYSQGLMDVDTIFGRVLELSSVSMSAPADA